MFMPDAIYRSVLFIGYSKAEEWHAGGTAFLIYDDHCASEAYVVTAAHVIREIMEKHKGGSICVGDDAPIELQVNLTSGGTKIVGVPYSKWTFHTDDGVDAAVARLKLFDDLDAVAIPTTTFAKSKVINDLSIGIRDEIFLAGLFTRFRGNARNIPIVRGGLIAAMPGPDEPIKWGVRELPMEAFLVECRSIGGLSGSPVWVHTGEGRPRAGEADDKLRFGTFHLLGLMHGHWSVDPWMGSLDREKINTGIAIVVPIDRVVEMIRSEGFRK